MALLEWLLGRPKLQWEKPQSYFIYSFFATAPLVPVLEMPRQIRATVAAEVNQAFVTLRRDEVYFCSVSGKASGSVLI